MDFGVISTGVKVRNYGLSSVCHGYLVTSTAWVCETNVLKIAKKRRWWVAFTKVLVKKCTYIWRLSTQANQSVLPALSQGSAAKRHEGNEPGFCHCPPHQQPQTTHGRRQTRTNYYLMNTPDCKNHKFVLHLQSCGLHSTLHVGERQSDGCRCVTTVCWSQAPQGNDYSALSDSHPLS